jgi:hypothetical protein
MLFLRVFENHTLHSEITLLRVEITLERVFWKIERVFAKAYLKIDTHAYCNNMFACLNHSAFTRKRVIFICLRVDSIRNLLLCNAGADWPYNEVGKTPRGSSSLGPPTAWPLFYFFFARTSFWTGAFARFRSYLITFWGPLEKNPTKNWGANPPLVRATLIM